MKITEIRGYHLRYHLDEPVRNSVGVMTERESLVVELISDSGVSGWGESLRQPDPSWSFLESQLAGAVLGRPPGERAPLWRAMRQHRAGHETAMLAASALDLAMWDLQGRIESRPVTELLGGRLRDRLTAYLSGPFMRPGADPWRDVRAETDRFLGEGFRAFKVRAGIAPALDGAMLAGLRAQVGPDIALMTDFNGGYALPAATDAIARCAGAGLLWVEEPVHHADLGGYQALRYAAVPVAGGESLSGLRQFAAFLRPRALSILQPDLSICGGFTGALKVAALAEAAETPVMPHVFGTVVNFYASLQLGAVLPGYRIADDREYPFFEYDHMDNALRSVLGEPGVAADGTIGVPDAPGIGIELSREQLHPYVRRAWKVSA